MDRFQPSQLSRRDYLKLIASEIDFWKQHQNPAGAIIDPYEKAERQYSTPAFAVASAILVREAHRSDLLENSTRAMTFALTALANHTTANNHADFYIPMLVHARRLLAPVVSKEQVDQWDNLFRSLIPESVYRDHAAGANWNIVNVSGEMLRRKDKLVATTQASAQFDYIERCLDKQQIRFTKYGMYEDPNSPLAYDAFPRCWLEDATAGIVQINQGDPFFSTFRIRGHPDLSAWLALGSISSLLLISPTGEWTSSGRSAHHQWNEAENALILEIEAVKWKRRGRDDIAGACKRAAHLCFTSMLRWVRPSGEMWIVKNRADPQIRLGYEGYSFHSQYNLLPMAMLAMAYMHADDSIAERPMPTEAGSFVFDLRDIYCNVVAACGGTFIVVNTGADPSYNATGLQRIHHRGVDRSPLTDSVGGKSHYSGRGAHETMALSPGLQWRERQATGGATTTSAPTTRPRRGPNVTTIDDGWTSLADFTRGQQDGVAKPYGPDVVVGADLHVWEQSPARISFLLRYALDGTNARPVEEEYTLTADGVEQVTRIGGKSEPAATRVSVPVLANDGERSFDVRIEANRFTVTRDGGTLTCECVSPSDIRWTTSDRQFASHNGFVKAIVADLPNAAREVRLRYRLTPNPPVSQ
jgi:hypothetical protein